MAKVTLKDFLSIEYPVRRFIWVFLLVSVVYILYRPIGLPLSISTSTRDAYETVNALPDGAVVLYDVSVNAGQFLDSKPGAEAMIRHLARLVQSKNIKIMFMSTGEPAAKSLLEQYLLPMRSEIEDSGMIYGQDWVHFGYIGGGETGLSAFASDIWGNLPSDESGTSISQIPMMANIQTADDIDLVFQVSGGTFEPMLRQVSDPFDTKHIFVIVSISVPAATPYYDAGQLHGFMNGQRGGAEYELLLGIPGTGASQMDGVSLVHMILVAVIIGGNISYWLSKSKEGGN